MKIDWNKKYTTIAVYVFIVVAACILFALALFYFPAISSAFSWLMGIISPLVYGLAIAYFVHPLVRFFERTVFARLHRKRPAPRVDRVIGIFLSFLLVLSVIIVFGAIIFPQLFETVSTLVSQLPGWYATAVGAVEALLVEYEIPLNLFDMLDTYLTSIINSVDDVILQIINTTVHVGTLIRDWFFGAIFAIYLLWGKEKLLAQSHKFLAAFFRPQRVDRFLAVARSANSVFSRFISGKLLESVVVGLICYIGMTILRLDYALLISVFCGAMNFIPLVGPFIGAVPSTLILLMKDPGQALVFVIFIVILQQVDGNVIGPRILGDSTGLTGFWVMLSILVGGGLFGFAGMFFGVPLFAVIYSLIVGFVDRRLIEKGLTTETSAYASPDNPLFPTIKKRERKCIFRRKEKK
ncbi:MAG: AI-2E family transporter [Ruminococcaceae bacterium]|nr:AI-2E family transporter [Oscillospiraceae bacterium]